MGQSQDEWLDDDDNLAKWENNELTAGDRRILIACWCAPIACLLSVVGSVSSTTTTTTTTTTSTTTTTTLLHLVCYLSRGAAAPRPPHSNYE